MQGLIRRVLIDMVPAVEDELISTTLERHGYQKNMMVGLYVETAQTITFTSENGGARSVGVTDFSEVAIVCKMLTSTATGVHILVGGM